MPRAVRHLVSFLLPWCCAAALLLANGNAAAQGTAPSAADFARSSKLSGFRVSPSNRHAAFLMRNERGRQVAAVVDLEKPGSVRVIAAYTDANVTSVFWVNDRRLVYEAYHPGAVIDRSGAGTFAVDLDGENRHQLTNWFTDSEATGTHLRSRVLNYGWQVWGPWDGKGNEVLAYREVPSGVGDFGTRQLLRVDTTDGSTRNPGFDQPPFSTGWTFDAQGNLRLVSTQRDGRERIFLRGSGQGAWSEIENEAALSEQTLTPLFIESDGTVIVTSRRGRDTQALHTYDPKTRRLSTEPLAAARDFDVGHHIETDPQAGQVVGIHIQADRLRSVWFDEGLLAAQKAVDAALPRGRINRLLCGNCLSAQRFVVRSSSDRLAAEYYVYDRKARSLVPMGLARPWLPEAGQGSRSFHRVAARDGLSLPVVVTHPPGREAERQLPAVVLVHGGPWLRGTDLAWSAEPQFLASRGYRVLEVDFRGSTGLGWKHFQAGWKQWGQAMQDDLADAVAWAVREGQIDASRVCIVGGSYGGYAALMGPVRHPGVYRCAASHAGVTDLALMFSGNTTDVAVQSRRYSYPVLIGDPKADAEMLRHHSPLHRVAEIKVPVLLVQGSLDRRVTKVHADRFESAARAAGVDIERVDYADDAHGWFEETNHADFLQRLERFLARALKPVP
jgi:dipeptidyl aminopeptidase/acylaminoacyl peptidase